MADDLRVGVCGAGMIGGVHVRAWSALADVRVVAVADPVADKAAGLTGSVRAEAVADLDAVLAAGVDVVSVCTPPTEHADVAITALEAGAHVVCEKPLARTLPDARRILAADTASPGLLTVGHVSRFEADHRAARDVVAAGQLGRVRSVTHSLTATMPTWSEQGWLGDPAVSGGPLLDLGVHSFDYARWLVGSEPVRVHAMTADTPTGPDTYALATVRFADGSIARVESSWAHPESYGFVARIEVVGTEGRLSWDYPGIRVGALHRLGEPATFLEPIGERGFPAELQAFVDAIRSGGPSPVPAEEGYRSLRTGLAALDSAQTGETVDLTAWEVS